MLYGTRWSCFGRVEVIFVLFGTFVGLTKRYHKGEGGIWLILYIVYT